MENIKQLISVDYVKLGISITMLGTILLSAVIYVYEILFKTDIENSVTYKGRDRVILSIMLFILFFIVIVIISLNEMISMYQEYGIIITAITASLISLFFSIVTLILISITVYIFSVTSLIPKYEVEIKKDEYWRIIKVTKDNKVILKKEEIYQILNEANELNNRKIRAIKKEKKK